MSPELPPKLQRNRFPGPTTQRIFALSVLPSDWVIVNVPSTISSWSREMRTPRNRPGLQRLPGPPFASQLAVTVRPSTSTSQNVLLAGTKIPP